MCNYLTSSSEMAVFIRPPHSSDSSYSGQLMHHCSLGKNVATSGAAGHMQERLLAHVQLSVLRLAGDTEVLSFDTWPAHCPQSLWSLVHIKPFPKWESPYPNGTLQGIYQFLSFQESLRIFSVLVIGVNGIRKLISVEVRVTEHLPTKKLTSMSRGSFIWSCPQEEVSTDFKIKDNEHKPSLMSNTYLSLYSHIKNMYKLQVMTGSGKKQDIWASFSRQCSCQGGECSKTLQTFCKKCGKRQLHRVT